MRDPKIELVAKLLLLSGTGSAGSLTADDMWRPQRDTTKDGFRVRAEDFMNALEAAGYKIVNVSDLEDEIYAAKEEAYDRGRFDERDVHFG